MNPIDDPKLSAQINELDAANSHKRDLTDRERRRMAPPRPPIPERFQDGRNYHQSRVRRGLKTDRIDPDDLNRYRLAFFCDDCVHFDAKKKWCSMGYAANHTRAEQMVQYEANGMMAFCRFCEID